MKHWHCMTCHHEWDASTGRACDWCGGGWIELSDDTQVWAEFFERVEEWVRQYRRASA